MYITLFKKITKQPEINYMSLLNDATPSETIVYKTTYQIEKTNNLSEKTQIHIQNVKNALQEIWGLLQPFEENYETQYYSFKIPKRSGGLRTINAPLPEFKEALSKTKTIFEQKIKCLAHDSAYAYTKQRSTFDALCAHQKNQSNWYLKIDLEDFFPNCTPEVIFKQLMQLYPFAYLEEMDQQILQKIIKVCCLNNGLPQGTPMSPLLTNLIMVPYDFTINNYLKRGNIGHLVYTRYADDILISSKSHFNWQELEKTLQKLLLPFKIKHKKTRYGSKAGKNWNLGLMLNKDNKITLGHKKKKVLSVMLYNFLKDFNQNILWPKEDVYHLQGELSYLKMVEPGYQEYLINKYQRLCNQNFKYAIKTILNPKL